MPELDEPSVTAWLRQAVPTLDGSGWPPPIRPIEQGANIQKCMTALGRLLDAAADADDVRRAACGGPLRGDLRSILAQVGAARLLRLIHWLGQGLADAEALLAFLADEHPEAEAIRSALDALVRQATLDRLFDPARIDALAAAVAAASDERV